MKTDIAKIAFLTLVTATLALPVYLHGQDSANNSMVAASTITSKHSKHGLPFHGTVNAVDTKEMTLTVGSRTFQITSKTKITKNGEPAELSDATVGEKVSGYYRTNAAGNLNAATIHFGTNSPSGQ